MEYILDYSKWRSGANGPWKVGIGHTEMLNDEGFSCCLGQFAKQVGVGDGCLLNRLSPVDASGITGLYDSSFLEEWSGRVVDTGLTCSLMNINDNEERTPSERIKAIREKLEEHGHTLKVINAPDGIE